MKAWQIHRVVDLTIESEPLQLVEVATPVPGKGELLLKVLCCGVCHTELDEIEGRTPPPIYPVIPGHQVIGIVSQLGPGTKRFNIGDRVGVAWIFSACGQCDMCQSGQENLCVNFQATGRDAHGGYADSMIVHENFAYHIPAAFSDAEAAPLLCAGAVGYRSLELAHLENGQALGLSGFGGSGHLVLLVTRHLFPASPVFVFARSQEERAFAMSLGATWAGDFTEKPPAMCHAIIDTTPAWGPIVASLAHLSPGGRLVINAIRKESKDQEALLKLIYHDHLWMEKEIKSVANVTRHDVETFLDIAAKVPIHPEVETFPFEKANQALVDLKRKHVRGAKVLIL